MKLIDDPTLIYNQVKWFEKHIKTIDVKYFNVDKISEKDRELEDAMDNYTSVHSKHLSGLRDLLNDKGLKALSNALASAKKRLNSHNQSLQITLDYSSIMELKAKAKSKNMSMSELVKTLLD